MQEHSHKELLDALHKLDNKMTEFMAKSASEHQSLKEVVEKGFEGFKRADELLHERVTKYSDSLEPRISKVELELEKGKSNMKLIAGLLGGAIVIFEIIVQGWGKMFG